MLDGAVELPGAGETRFSEQGIISCLSSRAQELIILPTEKCNFRCTYCYEDFLIGKMSSETQTALERFISNRAPELDVLSLHWFGGEPLVARDVVLRISRHAQKECESNDTILQGALTTNGYILDRELLEELSSCKQRNYQVTLDGWGEIHNQTRRLANGKGTFERIWTNISDWKKSDCDFGVILRIHVRRDNFESVQRLVRELSYLVADDFRFGLDFQHIRDLGGEGGKSVQNPLSRMELKAIEAELAANFVQARRVALQTKVDLGEIALSDPAPDQETRSPDPYICYAAKPNSLLVRADGRLGKCTVAFTDPRNTIGAIKPDGTVSIDPPLFQKWIRGFKDMDESTLACPIERMQ